MAYKEKLQANNTEISANTTDIQAAIDIVNALPDAGSGAKIDTCTVVLNDDSSGGSSNHWQFCATRYVDGKFGTEHRTGSSDFVSFPLTILDVVCGSPIYLRTYDTPLTTIDFEATNGSTYEASLLYSQMVITVTSTPDVTENITITLWVD